MVHLVRKENKGKIYLYLEERKWIDGRSRRVFQKYLGPEDKLAELQISSAMKKNTEKVTSRTMEFGISAVLWKIASDIGIPKIIDAHSKKSRDQGLSLGEYITIAAINRCAAPGSKSRLASWFVNDWLSTRFDIDPTVLDAQTYWNHFQYLDESTLASIERDLGKAVVAKYELDVESLFYDPTNFFTFSKGGDGSDLLQFGHSKENRNGLRLASYSLVCARESGVPLMHETYAGNIQDAKHFKGIPGRVATRLNELGRDPSKVTLVFDKGNHSDAAFKEIGERKFGFIVSVRNSTQKDLLQIPRAQLTKTTLPTSGKAVEYYKTTREVYGATRDVYIVLDPKKHEKHATLFQEKLDEKVTQITSFFKARLNVKKWRVKEKVEKKVKAMIGKKPFKDIIKSRISGTEGAITLDIDIDAAAKTAHVESLGRIVLITNQHAWSPEAVIWGYREEYIIERAFRRMKSPTAIAIRPMYHRANACIRAHVFVCVLALLLLSIARLSLARKGIATSYDEIIDSLRKIHATMVTVSGLKNPTWNLDFNEKSLAKIVSAFKLVSAVKA